MLTEPSILPPPATSSYKESWPIMATTVELDNLVPPCVACRLVGTLALLALGIAFLATFSVI